MKIDVKEKKENILLSRIEVTAEMRFDSSTPSNEDVKKGLSKELEVDGNLIVVKKIDTSYGDRSAKITAFQYLSLDDMKEIEPRDKKAEKKAAEKKQEKPVEKKEPAKEGKPVDKKEATKEEEQEKPKE